MKDDYHHEEVVNTAKLNPNSSDVYAQAIELDWNQKEHKEGRKDLTTNFNLEEDKENIHPEKVMRTAKRWIMTRYKTFQKIILQKI